MGRRKRAFWIGLLIFFTLLTQLGAQNRPNVFQLRWLGSPAPIHMGERGEIVIELSNLDPRIRAPGGIFQGRAPVNAIISESPPLEEGRGIYHYTITFIPLEERNIVLAPFTFQHDIYTFNIPGLNIQVRPSRSPESNIAQDETMATNEINGNLTGANQSFLPPFPDARGTPMPLLQREYDRIIVAVRSLWHEGLAADALAELRRNERDSLAGPYLSPLRREIEQILGLGFTENEKWRPLGIPIISHLFFLIAFLSIAVFFFVLGPQRKTRTGVAGRRTTKFYKKKSFVIVLASVLIIGFAFMLLEERLGNHPVSRLRSPGKTAVLRQTQGYRVPDFRGFVNDRFIEGQPVIVSDFRRDQRFDWYYAEAPDGRSGWVPRDAVITY